MSNPSPAKTENSSTAANPTTLVSDTSQYIGLIDRPPAQQLAFTTTLPEQKAESLKLATFNPKPEVAQRPAQQNDNGPIRCRDLVQQLIDQGVLPTGITRREGIRYIRANGYKCYDSPLYLYPEEPIEVSIKVKNAVILSGNPPYDPDKGWQVTAYPDGTLVKLVKRRALKLNRIDYSYSSSSTPPKTGFISSRGQLPLKLRWYAQKLGLAGREVKDFVTFWTTELPPAPYYFVSHFENPSKIMGFDITPKPDTFIQAIMYFRPLYPPNYPDLTNPPNSPNFPSIPVRSGFTAVDWSGIIDN